MIFITGDTHANIDISKLSVKNFPKQKDLSKNDYLIVCGDFGLVWDGSAREMWWQDWLTEKNFTTLWIDGNHENFDILREFSLTEKFGGVVREIAPDIFHLERGQVLTIDGKKIFVMGGWLALMIRSIALSIFPGGNKRCQAEKKWSEQSNPWINISGMWIMS